MCSHQVFHQFHLTGEGSPRTIRPALSKLLTHYACCTPFILGILHALLPCCIIQFQYYRCVWIRNASWHRPWPFRALHNTCQLWPGIWYMALHFWTMPFITRAIKVAYEEEERAEGLFRVLLRARPGNGLVYIVSALLPLARAQS